MSRAPSLPTATLRILQTTDMHMSVLPYDYLKDSRVAGASLTELAPMIAALSSEGPATCLFDTGDFLQGNALADFAIQRGPIMQIHPMISAMNAVGYDAVSLGNHEFDYGLITLMRALEGLDCPSLLANVTGPDNTPFFTPTTILTRDLVADDGKTYPVRLGVIGLVTPSTVIVFDSADPVTLAVGSMCDAAREYGNRLRSSGADIVVALCHAGVAQRPDVETAAQVAALPEIDVVLGGHVHDIFPDPAVPSTGQLDHQRGTLAGKPCVMSGAFGQHLGQIDLIIKRTDAGWRIADHTAKVMRTLPQSGHTSAVGRNIATAVTDAHQRTLTHIRHPVATAAIPINSFFARVLPDASLQLLADSNRAAMKTALAGHPDADLPLLTAAAPFCTGDRGGADYFVDIAPGPITMRAARAVFPFDNKLTIVRQSTAELVARLERAASQYLQITAGQPDQPLLNTRIPAYNADTLFGLTYRIDLSKSAQAGRISDLRYQGRPLQPDDRFLVGMSTFRAFGGGGYAPVAEHDFVYNSPYAIFEHLLSYLRTQSCVAPLPETVWRFAPIPGASALFKSSPLAAAHLTDCQRHQFRELGTGADGFCTYRMTF